MAGRPRKNSPRFSATGKSRPGTKTSIPKLEFEEDKPKEDLGYVCCRCGKRYKNQDGNFASSQSERFSGNNYHLPICRTCLDKEYDYYCSKMDDANAIRRVCMHWDFFYADKIVEASKDAHKESSRMSKYVSKLNLMQYKDKTYDTTLDIESTGAVKTLEDAEKAVEYGKVEDIDITAWGLGYQPEEYKYLNDKYDHLRATNVVENGIQDELVRDYCVQCLQKQKALSGNDIKLYDSLTSSSQKTLSNAHLTPKIQDEDSNFGEIPMGVMIKKFEDEDPIPKPRNEWKDVDGIIRMITIYFIGHLMKMLGLKNRYSNLYEEEMDKYRPKMPEDEQNADAEDVFDYVMNNSTFNESPSESKRKEPEEVVKNAL